MNIASSSNEEMPSLSDKFTEVLYENYTREEARTKLSVGLFVQNTLSE